jgi:hypothetical protein
MTSAPDRSNDTATNSLISRGPWGHASRGVFLCTAHNHWWLASWAEAFFCVWPAVGCDVKSLHAKIGELTLENEFFRGRAHQGGIAERKAMIDREHDLPINKAGGRSAHQPWHCLLSATSGVGDRP